VASIPKLNKVYASYKGQGLVLIGIHSDPDVAKRDACVKENKIAFPVCQAIGKKSPTEYKIDGYPTYYLIDKKGIIREVDPENLEASVKKALAAK
jgi:cytochrome c biogenesis protein CcmG, thiol:disulfide interchange protein DsbE